MRPSNKRAIPLAKALRKEKAKSIALQIAFDSVSNKLEDALNKFDSLKKQADKDSNRAQKFELESRMNARKSLDLRYMEVRGDFPILWINSPDQASVNAGTYAQIKDMLSRIAPQIECVILTYGDVKLRELDNNDLASIGLCRIKGHSGGAIGPDDIKRIGKKDE